MAPRGVSLKQRCERARELDAQALELRLQGLSLNQIAQRLGWTHESARRGLKRELKRRGLHVKTLYLLTPPPAPATIATRQSDELVEVAS